VCHHSLPAHKTSKNFCILDSSDDKILRQLGAPDFFLLHSKIEHAMKADLKDMALSVSSIFSDVKLELPLKGNKRNLEGYIM
jgi:hypothetical protein